MQTLHTHTHTFSSKSILPHFSDWPDLNCWMHPKEEGSPSGLPDNECPLSILESESHRERTTEAIQYSLTQCGVMKRKPHPFYPFLPMLPTLSPVTFASLFPYYIHIHMHLNLVTVCCTGTDIICISTLWPSDASMTARYSAPPPGMWQGNGNRKKSAMTGVISICHW